MFIGDAELLLDEKNGKPDRILRRNAEKRDEGSRSYSLAVVRCCSVANGGAAERKGSPGKTSVLETLLSCESRTSVGGIDDNE